MLCYRTLHKEMNMPQCINHHTTSITNKVQCTNKYRYKITRKWLCIIHHQHNLIGQRNARVLPFHSSSLLLTSSYHLWVPERHPIVLLPNQTQLHQSLHIHRFVRMVVFHDKPSKQQDQHIKWAKAKGKM